MSDAPASGTLIGPDSGGRTSSATGSPGRPGSPGSAGPDNTLHRNLKIRHVNLIAIGGAIGTGLFVGTGASISTAGPGGAVLSYGIIGVAIFFMMGVAESTV